MLRYKYGFQFATSIIPTVLITEGDKHKTTVHTARGFTRSHALTRAINWAVKHGDRNL